MSTKDYQHIIHEIADLRRRVANTMRVGTVHQVKGDKLRVNFATDRGGKEVLSPWIHHSNHRGEHRERQAFSDDKSGAGTQGGGGGQGGGGAGGAGGQGGGNKLNGGGQNVTCICPNGDFRQAFIIPYAPNRGHKPPDHAGKSGKGEHVYQFGELRKSRGKDGSDEWLEPEEQQNSQGGGGQGGGQQQDSGERKVGGDKATMKRRMNKETGITHRVGKDVRSMVHKDGAKMKADKDVWFVVSKKDKQVIVASKEPPITDKPWEIKKKKDPIEDDNK